MMLGGAAYSGLQLDSLMNDPASWDFPAARGMNQGWLGGSCNALLPRPSQMQPAKTWAWLGRRVDGETSRKPVRLARLLAQDEDGSPWRADPRFLGEAWCQSCRQRFRSAGVTAPRLEAKGPAEPQGSGDFVRARSTPGLKIFSLHLFSTNSEAVAAGSTQFGEAPERHPASQRLSQRSGQFRLRARRDFLRWGLPSWKCKDSGATNRLPKGLAILGVSCPDVSRGFSIEEGAPVWTCRHWILNVSRCSDDAQRARKLQSVPGSGKAWPINTIRNVDLESMIVGCTHLAFGTEYARKHA
jgi:hypothetical protein